MVPGIQMPRPRATPLVIPAVHKTAGHVNGRAWTRPTPWPMLSISPCFRRLSLEKAGTFSGRTICSLPWPWGDRRGDRHLGLVWGQPRDALPFGWEGHIWTQLVLKCRLLLHVSVTSSSQILCVGGPNWEPVQCLGYSVGQGFRWRRLGSPLMPRKVDFEPVTHSLSLS